MDDSLAVIWIGRWRIQEGLFKLLPQYDFFKDVL